MTRKKKKPKRPYPPGVFPDGKSAAGAARFRAVIYNGGARVLLGTFDTIEEASKAYRTAKHMIDAPSVAIDYPQERAA